MVRVFVSVINVIFVSKLSTSEFLLSHIMCLIKNKKCKIYCRVTFKHIIICSNAICIFLNCNG